MTKVFYLFVFFLFQSCRVDATEYDKIMNPIKAMKAAEKKAKKAAPVFDNVIEPDFPYEAENNKTLEGVDSNRDGVRDDIEIWINRTAEDEYVRQSLKEAYRKEIQLYESLANNEMSERIHSKLSASATLWECVQVLSNIYEKKYLEKYKKNAYAYYRDVMQLLYANTRLRKIQISKSDGIDIGMIDGDFVLECPKYSFGQKFLEIKESKKKPL
ncbi:MAG: hypothetical protein H7336_10980 [Bacteriovorax sp.]|nr:hypothetical protein [Bacteriovorax sp.]